MNKPKDMDKLIDVVRDVVADYACSSHDGTFTVKLCITVDDGWASVSEDNDKNDGSTSSPQERREYVQ